MLSRLMSGSHSGGAIATIALGAVWRWFVRRAREATSEGSKEGQRRWCESEWRQGGSEWTNI